MNRALGVLAVVLGVALAGEQAVASDPFIGYVYRWMITETAGGVAAPPLTLLWDRSPIWFEGSNPGGRSESPGRRIAEASDGFVTVMKRTLYLLDKQNGKTLWSLPLPGEEILDWKLAENMFLYSAVDYTRKLSLKGAIDLGQRKEAWSRQEPVSRLFRPDRLVPTPNKAVYSSDGDDRGANDEIVAIGLETGAVQWKMSKDLDHSTLVPFTWFVYGENIYILISPREGGLYIRSFDLTSGRGSARAHILGNDRLGNFFHPTALKPDGTLLIGYNKILDPEKRLFLGFNLNENKLLWNTNVTLGGVSQPRSFQHIVVSRIREQPIVATLGPNRFIVFDSTTGSVILDNTLQGYVGWTEPNAILYSYPYLFTSARRSSGSVMVYDLIALNVDTGKIEWSYEIDTQRGPFSTANAEILNFIVLGDTVYLSRTDGRIMAFRAGPASKP